MTKNVRRVSFDKKDYKSYAEFFEAIIESNDGYIAGYINTHGFHPTLKFHQDAMDYIEDDVYDYAVMFNVDRNKNRFRKDDLVTVLKIENGGTPQETVDPVLITNFKDAFMYSGDITPPAIVRILELFAGYVRIDSLDELFDGQFKEFFGHLEYEEPKKTCSKNEGLCSCDDCINETRQATVADLKALVQSDKFNPEQFRRMLYGLGFQQILESPDAEEILESLGKKMGLL